LINQIAEGFGSQCVVVAIDVNKDETDDYAVYVSGGHVRTEVNAFDWFKEVEERGAGEILLTAMHRDGTGIGFDNELMSRVAKERNIQVIASGGASNEQHFVDTFLAGSDAALAAGMFHRGEYSVQDVKKALKQQQILTR